MRRDSRLTGPIGALILMLGAQAAGTPQKAPTKEHLTVTWTIQSHRVTLGEPILLSYKVTNNSSGPISVHWKGENLVRSHDRIPTPPPWLTATVSSRSGVPVARVAEPTSPYTPADVMIAEPRKELAPGTSREGALVLSRFHAFRQPDVYRIALHVDLPYSIESDSDRQVYRSDQTIPITITAPNPIRLRQIARDLRKQAIQPAGFEEKVTSFDCLFSMPEEFALPAWRDLARDPRLGITEALETTQQLGRLGSATAVSLLYEMATNPKSTVDAKASARQALFTIKMNSPPEARAQIGKLLDA